MKLLLLSLMAAGAALQAGPVERHLQAADKLMRRGRLQDARLELEVAQRLAPQREDVRQRLEGLSGGAAAPAAASPTVGGEEARVEAALAQARAAYRDSDLKGAVEGWRRALQLRPGEKEAEAGLARLEAEAYHRDADQPFDQSVADLYEAALRESRKGRLLEARRKLEDALALNPTQPQVKAALAGLETGAQQQQEHQDAEALVLAGRQALKDHDLAAAGRAFQQALVQAPTLVSAQQGLAEVRTLGGKEARAALKKGQQALDQGDWTEAEAQFNLAQALDPVLEDARSGLQAARAKSKKARNAAEQRREADRLYNAGVEAWSAGDLGAAAGHFREVLRVDPQDAEATAALQAVRRKLDERAEKDRLDAVRLLEEGRTLEGRGAPEQALERYGRALAKDPALAEAGQAVKRLQGELQAP
jgi:tetratricopeptide (TPR) repeat protein